MEVIFFLLLLCSNANAEIVKQQSNGALSKSASDSAYFNIPTEASAATMTGPLTLAGSSLTVTGAGQFGGNVGIGTAVPAKPLHVKGEIWAGVSGAANDNVVYIQPGANGGKIEAYDFSGAGAKQLYLNPNGGNVGIGTTAPNTKLHISSGTLTMDGTGSPTAGYALCFQANKQMGKCTTAVAADGTCTCGTP